MILALIFFYLLGGYTLLYGSESFSFTQHGACHSYIDNQLNPKQYGIVGSIVIVSAVFFCLYKNIIKSSASFASAELKSTCPNNFLTKANFYGQNICITYDKYGNPILHKQKDT